MFDPSHIDYTALTQPVTRDEVRSFRSRVSAAHRADPSVATTLRSVTTVFGVVGAIFFIAVFALVWGSALVSLVSAGASAGQFAGVTVFLVLFGAIVSVVLFRQLGGGRNWAKLLRLSRFADANGLLYTSSASAPSYPGLVFGIGRDRTVTDHFVTPTGRFLDIGNYRYTTGSGKNQTTRHWGFLALQLDRNMPNIVLDSKANNSVFGSNLPTTFRRDQVLSLEGDFDKHFTLYCPKEYEQDALYVLTPDLMALLIDDAAPFDVEIVDSWIFFYSQSSLDMLSPATYQRLFGIVQTVGVKAIRQTAQYADDKVGTPSANIVAPGGQRLRHGVSIGTVVFFIVFAGIWIFTTFFGH